MCKWVRSQSVLSWDFWLTCWPKIHLVSLTFSSENHCSFGLKQAVEVENLMLLVLLCLHTGILVAYSVMLAYIALEYVVPHSFSLAPSPSCAIDSCSWLSKLAKMTFEYSFLKKVWMFDIYYLFLHIMSMRPCPNWSWSFVGCPVSINSCGSL